MTNAIYDQVAQRLAENRSPDRYILRAKRVSAEAFNGRTVSENDKIDPSQLYVVWFSKVLQNWKALVSGDDLKGVYFEVTYNGDKDEHYVDTYYKTNNAVIPG